MSVVYAPSSLAKGFRGTFLQQMAAPARNLIGRVASLVPSDSFKETYAWLGESPQMTEFKDELQFTPFSDTSYEITNKKFAAAIRVKREDIDDDQVGGISQRIRQMADVAKRHKNKVIVDALINGTADLCYDGTAFFGNSHPSRGPGSGSGTQDNLAAGTGITTAAFADDLNTNLATMAGFKAENGEPFHEEITKFTIVFPPSLRKSVREAIHAGIVANTSNVGFQDAEFDLIMESRLSDTNDWYLLHTGGPLLPIVFQDRDPLTYSALEDDRTEEGFIREHNLYKARARYNVGYGNWQHAIKVVNS